MITSNRVSTVLFYRSRSDLLWREFIALSDTANGDDDGTDLVTYYVHDVATYRLFKLDSIPIVKVFHGSQGGVTYKGPVSMHNLQLWTSYFQHSAVAKVESMEEYVELQPVLQTFLFVNIYKVNRLHIKIKVNKLKSLFSCCFFDCLFYFF